MAYSLLSVSSILNGSFDPITNGLDGFGKSINDIMTVHELGRFLSAVRKNNQETLIWQPGIKAGLTERR